MGKSCNGRSNKQKPWGPSSQQAACTSQPKTPKHESTTSRARLWPCDKVFDALIEASEIVAPFVDNEMHLGHKRTRPRPYLILMPIHLNNDTANTLKHPLATCGNLTHKHPQRARGTDACETSAPRSPDTLNSRRPMRSYAPLFYSAFHTELLLGVIRVVRCSPATNGALIYD